MCCSIYVTPYYISIKGIALCALHLIIYIVVNMRCVVFVFMRDTGTACVKCHGMMLLSLVFYIKNFNNHIIERCV